MKWAVPDSNRRPPACKFGAPLGRDGLPLTVISHGFPQGARRTIHQSPSGSAAACSLACSLRNNEPYTLEEIAGTLPYRHGGIRPHRPASTGINAGARYSAGDVAGDR